MMKVTELPTFRPENALQMGFLLPYYRSQPFHANLNSLNASGIAMLNVDVLVILYHLARYTDGPVLELGGYVGGGSIAMGWGRRDGNKSSKVYSVELGGAYEHPTHGSKDIARDLQENIRKHGVAERVKVTIGDSRSPDIVKRMHQLIGSATVDLLCIDSDGMVQSDFDLYRDLLAPRAYLVVDDFFSPGAPNKVIPTRTCINSLETAGIVEPLGIYGWGTWVGRLK
jgi:predicted O-methyltransferase YrrM